MIGRRAYWEPRTVLVTGAGPIGLLAALSANCTVWMSMCSIASNPAPSRTWCAPWAPRITGVRQEVGIEPDAIIECTGVGQVIADSIQAIGSGGTVCLTGVGHGGVVTADATADIAASAVLNNNVIVGSVNANKRHWYRAGEILARADRAGWAV